MRINVNDPSDFTIENLKNMMAAGDDSVDYQIRVTKDGFLFISQDTGSENLDGIILRLESFLAGNDYVGPAAAEDTKWVQHL